MLDSGGMRTHRTAQDQHKTFQRERVAQPFGQNR